MVAIATHERTPNVAACGILDCRHCVQLGFHVTTSSLLKKVAKTIHIRWNYVGVELHIVIKSNIHIFSWDAGAPSKSLLGERRSQTHHGEVFRQIGVGHVADLQYDLYMGIIWLGCLTCDPADRHCCC